MSGFGASSGGGGDDDESMVEGVEADADGVNPASKPDFPADFLADDMIENEAESLDMTEARRLASLPADELLARLDGSDASPKTKFVAVTMRIEQHQAEFDRLSRVKDALAGEPAPWWHQFANPTGHYRMFDSRYGAYARGKAHSAFRDAGGSGPFAAVTTVRDAARFAVQQVAYKAAGWLQRLARRFE